MPARSVAGTRQHQPDDCYHRANEEQRKYDTGGNAEFLILDYADCRSKRKNEGEIVCSCLIKASKRPKAGTNFKFEKNLKAEVIDFQDGVFQVRFYYSGDFERLLYSIGKMPLPPYIRRGRHDHQDRKDETSYQTVYAARKGAVAAPTGACAVSR